MNDLYKCCRWCHHYSGGKCYKNNVTVDSNNVYAVSESGKLSEVLKEVIEGQPKSPFKELEYLLMEYKVSNKRIKEFTSKLMECFDEYHLSLVEKLDEEVSVLYQSELDSDNIDGVEINDPETFCCNHFE